jgi:hydroxymethylglutaryl-CoA lyase
VLTPNQKGLERAIEAGAVQVAIFTAASNTFNQKNINKTIAESLKEYEALMTTAQNHNLKVRGYVSTCFVCPYEGEIAPSTVVPVIQALLAMGCYEVSIGDTIGAAVPTMIEVLLEQCFKEGIKPEQLALHCHDTYGTALANITKGLELGISTIDSSAGGLGGCPYAPGASGNVATEDVLYLLNTMGIKTGVDINEVAKASMLIEQTLGKLLPSKQLQRLKTQNNCFN